MPIQAFVDYELREYKQVLRDFLAMHLAAKESKPNRLLPWNWPVAESAVFGLVVPVVFWLKKWRIGSCTFTFDETGLTRVSKTGTSTRTWSEIKAVHRLSGAYLIELKAGGAMPVPYRAFGQDSSQLFETLADRINQRAA